MIKTLLSLSKYYLNNSTAIINWSLLERCILILLLAGGLNTLWLIWKTYIILSPDLHHYVNIEIVKNLIGLNILFVVALFTLIYPCYKLRASLTAQKVLPYICIGLFVFTLIFDGYYIGIMSPATVCGLVCVVSVGLIIFSRRLVYTFLFPSLAILSYLMYQSIVGHLPYAPIFQLGNLTKVYFNPFWLGSMIYFMTPIITICFLLFDLMLQQWRTREQTYQALSQIDPLTRLLNRRSINEHIVEIEQHPLATYCIILMDIDFFKNINDTYGHLKGDEVLSRVADELKAQTRPEDLVGRYGGEEFIILVKTSDKTFAYQVAERCRTAIMNIDLSSNHLPLTITASFGVAYWDTTSNTIQEALHQADVAMYQAKEAGRNLVKFAH